MAIAIIALYLLPAFFGTVALAASNIRSEKVTLVLLGAVGGTMAATTFIYLAAALLPLPHAAGLIFIILTAGAILLLMRTPAWRHWRAQPFDPTILIVFSVALCLFFPISRKLLIADDQSLSTGIINAYGDVAWHTANITLFAAGQTYPPENPIFAGTTLNYPFLPNFFSSISRALGSSLSASLNFPAIVFIPVFLALFYRFAFVLTNARLAAVLAVLLFLFAGATLGFTRLPADFAAADTSWWEFLLHLPARDYSGVGNDTQGYHFLNPVTTLLLPQRNLLFGLPAALAIILLLLPPAKPLASYLAAGLLAGLLPLFHAHSALAIAPLLLILALWQRDQNWWLFFALAGLVGLPSVIYYLNNPSSTDAFLRWGPGWLSGDSNYLWYWFKNTGFLLPAVIVSLVWRSSPFLAKATAAAGLVVFTAANLWLFAPWAWDNFKLFVYFLLFSLPLIAQLATAALRRRQVLITLCVISLLVFQTAAAALDLWKIILPTARVWNEWDSAALAAGDLIARTTEPGATILTAPIHNSPVALAGRPQYLGYAAHVWSHGGDPWQREAAIEPFYAGRLGRLPETDPQYALVGPVEQAMYQPSPPSAWQPIASTGTYTLYRLPPPAQNVPQTSP